MKRTPLTRRTALKSTRGPERRRAKPSQRKPPKPGFSDQTKAVVRGRSGNRCEIAHDGCTGRGEHFHHRKLRGHGDHRDLNCLHVCAVGHELIHHETALAYTMGWLVHSWDDPAKVPVLRVHAG